MEILFLHENLFLWNGIPMQVRLVLLIIISFQKLLETELLWRLWMNCEGYIILILI